MHIRQWQRAGKPKIEAGETTKTSMDESECGCCFECRAACKSHHEQLDDLCHLAKGWILHGHTVTSQWVRWRHRSSASPLFTQPFKVRFHLRGAVTTVRSGFWGNSVFMLCVSTTAGRRRDGIGCPRRVRRNGSWSHFSVPPCGAVVVLRQLVVRLLKYRSRDIDIKMLRSLWNWTGYSAVVLLTHLSNFKAIGELYQSPGVDISRNLSIRYLNSFLNRASTGRVVMLIKTEWELCSDMTIIYLHYYEGVAFCIGKRDISETCITHVVLYAGLVWFVCLCSYSLPLWLKIRK